MSNPPANSPPAQPASPAPEGSKTAFIRQGSWMVMATVGGGVFMTAVHTVAAKMKPEEYSVFVTLLRCLILLGIPAGGLQTVFAQQVAGSFSEEEHRRLCATTRSTMAFAAALWVLLAGTIALFQEQIVTALKIVNPAGLWATAFVVLISLWLPVVRGLLQGRQHFKGLGWVAILDGVGRFTAIAVIVLFLGGQAAGAMAGALLGQIGSLAVAVWLCRDILRERGGGFEWGPWLGRVVPLTLGSGALLFLQTADVIYVQSIFSAEKAPFYMPGAMIGFALVQFTGPLAAVMFPKIVRSAARAEKTDALKLTLATTALMGGLGAVASTLLPKLPLQILYFSKPQFWASAPLVPWFAWCMLFYTLANVLVGNLLARARFAIVPWLLGLVATYGVTLALIKDYLLGMDYLQAFIRLVQVLGIFNVLLVAVSAWYTWGGKAGREE